MKLNIKLLLLVILGALSAFAGAQSLTGLTVAPSSVVGGTEADGVVNLSSGAGPGGVVVDLESNSAYVTVPSSVTVKPNWTQGAFNIDTVNVSADTVATISAQIGGGAVQTGTLTVTPATVTLASTFIGPVSVTGGAEAECVVQLSGPAGGPSGTVVNLESDSPYATIPSSVTVAAGHTTAGVNIDTVNVNSDTTITVTAQIGSGTSQTASLTIMPADLSITAFSINPSSVTGGNEIYLYVTLSGEAPQPSGTFVGLQSSNNAVQDIPPNIGITVAAGHTTGQRILGPHAVDSTTAVTITATVGSSSMMASVTVIPTTPIEAYGHPNYGVGGGFDIVGPSLNPAYVLLNGVLPSNQVVTLTSSLPEIASVPASISVPDGDNSSDYYGFYYISAYPVDTPQQVTISAILNGTTVSFVFTVNPASIVFMHTGSHEWSEVVGGTAGPGSIMLNGGAGPSGITVNLTSSNPAIVQVPPSAVIDASQPSGTFTFTSSIVQTPTVVTVTATQGSTTVTSKVTVEPTGTHIN